MKICIIGAAGDIGKQIVSRIIREKLMGSSDAMQLVGSPKQASQLKLLGMIADLNDGYAEIAPNIELVRADQIESDIIIFSAGKSTNLKVRDRADLALKNLPIMEHYRDKIKLKGHEIIVIVTNPVELGVKVFSKNYDRNKVIGMGSHQDTLRFRREIANELSKSGELVRRQQISGFMVGEHGLGMVPLWSTVKAVPGEDIQRRLDEMINDIRAKRHGKDFFGLVKQTWSNITNFVDKGRFKEAFEYIDNALEPDLRALHRPRLIVDSQAKTAFATASSTVNLIRRMIDGRGESLVSAQVVVDNEFHGVHGPFGIPVALGPLGWRKTEPPDLLPEESRMVRQAATKIEDFLDDIHNQRSITVRKPNNKYQKRGQNQIRR